MSLYDQTVFYGETECLEFIPNRLRPNMCTDCFKKLQSHKKEAIKSEEIIRHALEYSQGERLASEILPSDDDTGALFLGGFKAVLNPTFMSENSIQGVVNTARGLEIFGPKYIQGKHNAKERGVEFVELGWVDGLEQVIEEHELLEAIQFIHSFRSAGKSVLVHCAQGKSRSSTVVVAYLAALNGTTIPETLEFVQTKRAMAEPNENFMNQLVNHWKNGVFNGALS